MAVDESVLVRRWDTVFRLRTCVGLTTAGVAVAYAMQYAHHDPFPPEVSVSAYGLGPYGWMLTLASTLIGLGSLPLVRHTWSGPLQTPRAAPILVSIWTACMITLGWVHTNEPHTPATSSTLVHQSAAVLGMVVFPVGVLVMAVHRRHRALAGVAESATLIVLSLVSVAFLVLLFFAAFGVDTAGLGAHRSWALYQFLAAVVDVAVVYLLAAVFSRDLRRDRTPTAVG